MRRRSRRWTGRFWLVRRRRSDAPVTLLVPACRHCHLDRAHSAVEQSALVNAEGFMRWVLMVATTVLMVPAAAAGANDGQTREAMFACKSIADPLQRLVCFDGVAANVDAAGGQDHASSEEEGDSKWSIEESVSSIDGKKSVVAIILSDNESPNIIGRNERSGIAIRCNENKTEVIFSPPNFIGLDGASVTYRIDQGAPIKQWWSSSTNGRGAFAGKPISFIREMSSGKTLAIRIGSGGAPPQEAVFTIGDMSDAIAKVSSACGWKP